MKIFKIFAAHYYYVVFLVTKQNMDRFSSFREPRVCTPLRNNWAGLDVFANFGKKNFEIFEKT
jgi:hypothetical protein